MNNSLIKHIQSSPLVNAAITEAVHRFYHDRILSDKESDRLALEETCASDILTLLWNLQPNWRYIIAESAKRYNPYNTNSVPIDGKPKDGVILSIQINIPLKQEDNILFQCHHNFIQTDYNWEQCSVCGKIRPVKK